MGVVTTFDLQVAPQFLHVCAGDLQTRHTVDRVDRKAEPVGLVLDRKLERRVDVALFLVAAHVQVGMVTAP